LLLLLLLLLLLFPIQLFFAVIVVTVISAVFFVVSLVAIVVAVAFVDTNFLSSFNVFIKFHLHYFKGDHIHCVDVLQALVRQLLGDIEQENPDAFVFMQKKLEEAFLAAFPNRAKQRRETTTFVRNREICAALVIQKAWRVKVLKNSPSFQ
jgi:hypothetical protein